MVVLKNDFISYLEASWKSFVIKSIGEYFDPDPKLFSICKTIDDNLVNWFSDFIIDSSIDVVRVDGVLSTTIFFPLNLILSVFEIFSSVANLSEFSFSVAIVFGVKLFDSIAIFSDKLIFLESVDVVVIGSMCLWSDMSLVLTPIFSSRLITWFCGIEFILVLNSGLVKNLL